MEDPGDTNNDSGIDECILPPSGDDNLTHDHCSVLSENQTSAQNLCSRPCSPDSMASDTTDNNEIDHDDSEITIAILKSLNLVDQMSGSISDFEDILQLSKELFCRNDRKLEERWPRNWQETQSVLKNCGYKAPRELYVCLDESHYAQWDVMMSWKKQTKCADIVVRQEKLNIITWVSLTKLNCGVLTVICVRK